MPNIKNFALGLCRAHAVLFSDEQQCTYSSEVPIRPFCLFFQVVGILGDDTDPMVSVMKVETAPTESYADIGGLESQIQEIKEAVELPLAHPEL
jgi:ATP-dependent 26S proteasome regulatory subunit